MPIDRNPIKQVKKPTANSRRERRLQAGELTALLNACAECRNTYIRPLILFAIETGMRRGEMLALTWDRVDWVDHTAHIPHTKNGEARTIPLTLDAQAILEGIRTETTGKAFPISPESVKKAWQRLVSRAAIVNLHFHDLRHEAVSRFFELGLSLPEVALISGHKDPRMLFRYTHLSAAKIAQKLRPEPGVARADVSKSEKDK